MAGQFCIGGALNLNNSNQFGSTLAGAINGPLSSVRVKSIVLDQYHPRFKELGEWSGLGTIEYEHINAPTSSGQKLQTARPAFPNLKQLPLINEIVYIFGLPGTNIASATSNRIAYYISVVSVWNHPHHNGFPSFPNTLPDSQQKDYIQTEAGSVRRVTDQSTEIFLGQTFFERSEIKPLLPYEGDVIYEGRWGNSLRFGSTVNGANNPNLWSTAGINGDPITIIRNGQTKNTTTEGWIPILEDVNEDLASIYLGSTQKIPLQAASINYNSYTSAPTVPSEYEGSQVIVTSDRLVFNAAKDHLLLSSNNSIGLNSLTSVNVDTDTFNISAQAINLGTKSDNDSQPILLGKDTVTALKDLIDSLTTVLDQLSVLASLPPGAPFAPLNMVSKACSVDLKTIQSNLDLLLSDKVRVINSKVSVSAPFQAPTPPAPITIVTPENSTFAEVTDTGQVIVDEPIYPTEDTGSLESLTSGSEEIPSELSSSLSASVPVSASIVSSPDFEVDSDLFGDFTYVDVEPELPPVIPFDTGSAPDPVVTTDPPVINNNGGYTVKELPVGAGKSGIVYVIPNKPSDPNSICVVFGGTKSVTYGGKFMYNEFKKGNEPIFNNTAFVFMDWEYGENNMAKAKANIKQNYPNLNINSIVVFSKSGRAGVSVGATSAGKAYKFIGFIDPSPEAMLTKYEYTNNSIMIYNKKNWGTPSYYVPQIDYLINNLKAGGSQTISLGLGHSKMPAYFAEKYGHLC